MFDAIQTPKLVERPLTVDTLGIAYVRQHRPGHGRFIAPTARDLAERKRRCALTPHPGN